MSHPSGCNLTGLRQGLWETRPPRQGCGRQAQDKPLGDKPPGDKPLGDKGSGKQGLWEPSLRETRALGDKPPGASSPPALIYLTARAEQVGVP